MNYLLSYEALPPEIKAQLTRITESWKTDGSQASSDRYLGILRIVSGAFLGVGILMLVRILK